MKSISPKLLILEDSVETQLILKATLSSYDITLAQTISQALSIISKKIFDLYIFDIVLPDGESQKICQKLKQSPKTCHKPVLFISSRMSDFDKISAFNEGADDYITKPFSTLELKARVQARLRNWTSEQLETLTYPPLVVDLPRRKAFVKIGKGAQRDLELTSLEFEILVILCKRPEVVRTRQMLIDQIWGESVSVTERTVDVHIYNLRQKLGPLAEVIRSNHGHGYCFVPPRPSSVAS